MYFSHNEKTKQFMERLTRFMDAHVYPNEEVFEQQVNEGDRWQAVAIERDLKIKAREAGLWNLFLPEAVTVAGETHGGELNNTEYAPLAEIMGRVTWAPYIFNCNAPDTGNMEVLARYGTTAQQEQWLQPLLDGEIRSCFAMTEPDVASSDATNMQATATLEGDEWVINGRKWYITGAADPRCQIIIFMGLSNPEAPRHQQHSQILVPMNTPGVTRVRPLSVFGYDDAPYGHCELLFENVRVPKDNIILGPGRGFEIAQGRLGPGRIHHCMRAIGAAERALALFCQRGSQRVAFGKPLVDLGANADVIADCRININMARQLTLNAAYMMDTVGNKVAASEIAQIKVAVPNITCEVLDQTMQLFGAAGLSQDTILAASYANLRMLRLADGPDAVHRRAIARLELKKHR